MTFHVPYSLELQFNEPWVRLVQETVGVAWSSHSSVFRRPVKDYQASTTNLFLKPFSFLKRQMYVNLANEQQHQAIVFVFLTPAFSIQEFPEEEDKCTHSLLGASMTQVHNFSSKIMKAKSSGNQKFHKIGAKPFGKQKHEAVCIFYLSYLLSMLMFNC